MILYGTQPPSQTVGSPSYLEEMLSEGVLEYGTSNGLWAWASPVASVVYDIDFEGVDCVQSFNRDGMLHFLDRWVLELPVHTSALQRPDLGMYRSGQPTVWWHSLEIQAFGQEVSVELTVEQVGNDAITEGYRLECRDFWEASHVGQPRPDLAVHRAQTGVDQVREYRVYVTQVCGTSSQGGHFDRLSVRLCRWGGIQPVDGTVSPAGGDHPYAGGDLVVIGERDPAPLSTEFDDVDEWGGDRSHDGVGELADRTTRRQPTPVDQPGDYWPFAASEMVQAVGIDGGDAPGYELMAGQSPDAVMVCGTWWVSASWSSGGEGSVLEVVDDSDDSVIARWHAGWTGSAMELVAEVDGADVDQGAIEESTWYDPVLIVDPVHDQVGFLLDGEFFAFDDYADLGDIASVSMYVGGHQAGADSALAMPYAWAMPNANDQPQVTRTAGYLVSYHAWRRMMMSDDAVEIPVDDETVTFFYGSQLQSMPLGEYHYGGM